MEDCIRKELNRLRELNLVPSSILINSQVYEDIKKRYIAMVRVYGGDVMPPDTFMGLPVHAVPNLKGAFQVAVENEVQSLRDVL